MKSWSAVLGTIVGGCWLIMTASSCSDSSTRSLVVVPPVTTTMTKAEQQAITPDQALERLKAGNQRFTSGHVRAYDSLAQAEVAARGQYPFATILSCVDSRSTPETIFDLGVGDAFVPRIAGNIATPEIIGSMEFACKVAGAKIIVVIGHNECGAVKGACDGVKMDNLTLVMADIDPAVAATTAKGERNSRNKPFVQLVATENVRHNIDLIRARSPILSDMESKGEIKIIGAMQDLESGTVTWLSKTK